jgi:hypothetical protein
MPQSVLVVFHRWSSLFAVDTSRFFGPQILNSQIKRHSLARNSAFFTNVSNVNKRIRGKKDRG